MRRNEGRISTPCYLLQMAADISDLVHYSEDLRALLAQDEACLDRYRPKDFMTTVDMTYAEARTRAEGLPFASLAVWIQAFCASLQERWEA